MLRRSILCLIVILSTVFLWACGGSAPRSANDDITGATVDSVRKEPPLKDKFSNLLISQVSAAPEVLASYPTAAVDLKTRILTTLEAKNQAATKYKKAGMKDATQYPGSTVFVEVSIPEMRMVGTGARIWAGAFAGKSFINVHVRLTDATGRVVHEKTVGTYASAFAAEYSGGANDRSLINDMGEIVGEYLYSIIPGE